MGLSISFCSRTRGKLVRTLSTLAYLYMVAKMVYAISLCFSCFVCFRGGILFLGFILGFIIYIAQKNSPNIYENIHGSARWATLFDIKDAGLLDSHNNIPGIYIGGFKISKRESYYLIDRTKAHAIAFAPTRSGKGVSLVVPTILSWPESIFVLDLKGELYQLSAGWRGRYAKNQILRFAPSESNSVAWNPMAEIRMGTDDEVGDTQNVATLLVDPKGQGLKTHWDHKAFSLLTGLIIYALYKAQKSGQEASLAMVDAILVGLQTDQDPIDEKLNHLQQLWVHMGVFALEVESMGAKYLIQATVEDMLSLHPEELSSVVSTTKNYLKLFRDPRIGEKYIKERLQAQRPHDVFQPIEPLPCYRTSRSSEATASYRPHCQHGCEKAYHRIRG